MANEQHKPAIFVDSGNLLFKQPTFPTQSSQELMIAEGIIKIYTAMKVDAVAVGPFDLAAGLDLLQTSFKHGFPWLSANLLDQNGHPLFATSRIRKVGKIKAGLIGITGTTPSLPEGVVRADWQVILPSLIKKTAPQCDILILLSSLTPAENQEIATRFPTVHIILANNQDNGNMPPQLINNTLITQTERQGKYQGILTIAWHKSGKWETAQAEELTTLRNRLGALDWQLQRMHQKQEVQQPDYLEKIKLVEQNRAEIAQQIITLEQNKKPAEGGASTFSHTFLALGKTLPESAEIKSHLDEIKRRLISAQQSITH
jgi:2',3'-cyclic-nucleotide 2'-phosphodiesterase (5'-nucleotidase family)